MPSDTTNTRPPRRIPAAQDEFDSPADLGWSKATVARCLGISVRHFDRHCLNSRSFPEPFYIGDKRLWRPEEIRDWRDALAKPKKRTTGRGRTRMFDVRDTSGEAN